jgi:TATA-box binding protein (TBP) (component of TFIID and TFIIIB)
VSTGWRYDVGKVVAGRVVCHGCKEKNKITKITIKIIKEINKYIQ